MAAKTTVVTVVNLLDGRSLESRPILADFAKWEEHFNRPIKALSDGYIGQVMYLAFLSLTRQGDYTADFDTFMGAVESLGETPKDTQASES